MTSPEKKTLLITGAAGRIGTALRAELATDYRIRCFARAPLTDAEDVYLGDVTDIDTVEAALHGTDAVIHLAADSAVDQEWAAVHSDGIDGTYTVLEGARRSGVGKVILASSSFVSGWQELRHDATIGPCSPVCPTSLYGVGKLAVELLGQYFATRFGMSVACLRIGAFYPLPPRPDSEDHHILRTWCSPRDLAQLVHRCVDADGLGFAVFYAVSNNSRRVWDISNARELVGYQPEDDAERLLDPSAYGDLVKRILRARRHAQ